MKHLPRPSCPRGYTDNDLTTIFGDELPAFHKWMDGQTCAVCNGKRYNRELRVEEPSECAANPHGIVTYTHDLKKYYYGKRKDEPVYD